MQINRETQDFASLLSSSTNFNQHYFSPSSRAPDIQLKRQ